MPIGRCLRATPGRVSPADDTDLPNRNSYDRPEHAGLGSGTELPLSVAAGLNAFWGLPARRRRNWAERGPGSRSAVGTYGFVFGGLIVEQESCRRSRSRRSIAGSTCPRRGDLS